MYIIVGLGNPDARYAQTRHNTGYLAADLLAGRNHMAFNKQAFKAAVAEGYIGGKKVVIAKPVTYMNLSGESVVQLLNWYKIDPAEELIVLYDDIDLAVGDIRLRARGSAGTHNGMRSIIGLTGRDDFARVRIGIGKPAPGWDLAGYVLSIFPEEERPAMRESITKAAEAVECILSEGIDSAQTRYNKKPKRAKPPKPEKKGEALEAKENQTELKETQGNA